MKHLKLFFACLVMLFFTIGQVWGAAATVYTSNVTLSTAGGTQANAATVTISSTNYDAIKLGKSGNGGNFSISVPANTATLTLHAAGWNGKSTKLTLSTSAQGVTISPSTDQSLTSNSGVANNSPFTITPDNTKEFFTFTLTGVNSATIIKLTSSSERCVIWGVNAEAASSEPTVSLNPSSLTNLAATDVEDQEVTVTCTNFASDITSITTALFDNAECSGDAITSGAWVTDITVNDAKTKVSFKVADNDGAARQVWLKVTATDGSSTESAILPISQKLYVAPLTTMDAIFAAATAAGSTATDVTITFNNWVVSGVNGSTAYVTDGAKGFIIYKSSNGFAVNDKLNGTVAGSLKLFKGAAEEVSITSSTTGLTVTKDGVVTPVEKAISALSGVNTGAPIIVKKVRYNGTTLVDANSNEIKPFNTLYSDMSFTNGKLYNVTGIYLQFDETKEILPRSAADIVEIPEPRVTVKNDAEEPETITSMAFGNVGQRWQQSFVFGFSYENLEAGDLTMTIGGTDAEKFEFYNNTQTQTVEITSASGSVSSLSFHQATEVAGTYNATLTISGCGLLENVVLPITMTVKAPEFSVSPSAVHFGDVKQHMKATETFTLTGKYLSGDYSVKISAYGAVFDVLAANETYYIWPDENKEINETVTVICDARNNVDPNTYQSHLVLQSTSLVEEFEDIEDLINFDATVVATYPVRFQVNDNDRGTITINGEASDEYGKATAYVVNGDEAITMVANPKLGWKLDNWQVANADESKVAISDAAAASTYAYVSAEPEDYITAVFIKDCTPLDRPSNTGYITTTYNSANLRWQWVWEDENKAATYHIHAFETENPSEEIDVNIELTSAEMEESNVYRTLTGLKGNTAYTIQIWGTSVADGFCPTGEVAEFELTTAPYPAATLTLSENGIERAWGSDLKVASEIELPAAPAVSLYGKTFVGWVEESDKDYTHATDAPATIWKAGDTYTVDAVADKLYALYATATPGEKTLSQTLQYDTWTYSGTTTDKSTYRLFGSDAYVESAAFDLSTLAQVDVYAGTFGSMSDKSVKVLSGTTTWGTFTMADNKATTKNEVTSSVKLAGNGKIRIQPNEGDGSGTGARISKVEIYTIPCTYSDYATTGTHIIEWSAEAGKAYTVIKEGVLPTLANPESVAVTYSSTDETVATINASTGEITPLKAGTTTIKATYETVVVSYALTVYAPSSLAVDGTCQTAYEYGDSFDRTGITATLTFGDSETADVTSAATWTISGQDEYTVTANAQLNVVATFGSLSNVKQVDVTVNTHAVTFSAPANGTLVIKNGETPISSGNTFVKNTVLTVEAEPASALYELATLTAGGVDIKASKEFTIGTADVAVVATYTLKPFASLEALVAANLDMNVDQIVTVSFSDVEITEIKTGEIFLNVKDEHEKNISIYVGEPAVPTGWSVGGKVSGTAIVGLWVYDTDEYYWLMPNNDWTGITYKAPSGLAWSDAEATAYTVGKSYSLPTLTNPNSLTVAYSSSNTDAATINAETGAISIVAAGTTTITATFAGNDDYIAKEVSYELTVVDVKKVVVTGTPKTAYEYDESFSFTGLGAKAIYNNDEEYDIPSGGLAGWTATPTRITENGKVKVTVTWATRTSEIREFDVTVIPNFYITGTAVGATEPWNPALVPVIGATSYTIDDLEPGSYSLKITTDGTWSTVKGFDDLTPSEMVAGLYRGTGEDTNIYFTLKETSDVTVTYDGEIFKLAGNFLPQIVSVKGAWDSWAAHEMTLSLDKKSASVSFNIAAAENVEFGVLINTDDYRANSASFDRSHTSETGITGNTGNMKLTSDKTDTYTFTWTFGTNALSITFPEQGGGTALDNAEAQEKAVKFIENNQIFIRRGDKTFNAQGQLVK